MANIDAVVETATTSLRAKLVARKAETTQKLDAFFALMNVPSCVSDISKETGLPYSTVMKHVKDRIALGWFKEHGYGVKSSGKSIMVYKVM